MKTVNKLAKELFEREINARKNHFKGQEYVKWNDLPKDIKLIYFDLATHVNKLLIEARIEQLSWVLANSIFTVETGEANKIRLKVSECITELQKMKGI